MFSIVLWKNICLKKDSSIFGHFPKLKKYERNNCNTSSIESIASAASLNTQINRLVLKYGKRSFKSKNACMKGALS